MSIPERYRRLDAFLQRVRGEIYAEPAFDLHDKVTREMAAYLLKTAGLPPGAKVLDVGCGQGLALELFRDAGLAPVGITLGEDLEVCRGKGLDVVEMDFSFLDFPDESFHLVWCRHALEHSIFPYFTLAEMHRVLKPGGVLYVEVPAPDTACAHQANPNHYSVLPKSMWLELMRRTGFVEPRASDLQFKTGAGPDLYWAFFARKPG
ncbi:class I SAM-dependent methyltransferase [Phenylobacterium sp.]|jgi:ubiquinone/menaquinone biosynthesis C-methylase UbiE|uniref:class I SAM-dependent methyltransferase n=1 Tax=Phenylobacterium sp. TaxID=1871053 RepID=UPI002F93951E